MKQSDRDFMKIINEEIGNVNDSLNMDYQLEHLTIVIGLCNIMEINSDFKNISDIIKDNALNLFNTIHKCKNIPKED